MTIFKRIFLLSFVILISACGSSDKDDPVELGPTLSISSQTSSIWEGQQFQFKLTLSKALNADATVKLAIDESQLSDNMLVINDSAPIVIPAGTLVMSVPVDLASLVGVQGSRGVTLTLTEIDISEVSILASNQLINFTVSDGLVDRIYKPLKIKYETDRLLNFWQQDRLLKFVSLNYNTWALPSDPTWAEDPYSNVSWQFYYHSLTWLHTLIYGYETTGEQKYLDEVKYIIFDWIKDNGTPADNTNRGWNDHATAYRAAMFSYLYERFFKDVLTDEELDIFDDSIALHAETLSELLVQPEYIGHNHGLFHGMGLLTVAKTFPHLSASTAWNERAVTRLNELITEMIDVEEGISVEQAIVYHYAAIDMFLEVGTLLNQLEETSNDTISEVLSKALDFSALTTLPNGTSPALGDTSWNVNLEAAFKLYVDDQKMGSAISEYVSQKGAKGEKPAAMNVFPNNGYVTYRPEYSADSDWKNDMYLFADFGKERKSHGHHDSLSFTYYNHGKQLLVDSGGPYRYRDRQYWYFAGTIGHNLIVVDDKLWLKVDTTLNMAASNENVSYINGERSQYAVNNNRSIVTLGKKYLVVVDRLIQSGGGTHTYDLLYHFAPESNVIVDDQSSDNHLRVGASFVEDDISVFSEVSIFSPVQRQNAEVIEGRYDPDSSPLNMQGWVSDGYNSKIPAPTLSAIYRDKDMWLVTIFSTSDNEADAKNYNASVSGENGGEINVSLSDNDIAYELKFLSDNTVKINGTELECNHYCGSSQ